MAEPEAAGSGRAGPDAVVVGSGVIGMSVAVRLAESGRRVRIVAEATWPGTTSRVAGAVWHPYLVAGPHVLRWAGVSYRVLAGLAAEQVPGVRLAEMWELDSTPTPDEPSDPGWAELVEGYRRLGPSELPPGWTAGRAALVPVVETARYLPWLADRAAQLGVTWQERRLDELGQAGPAPLVVNCSGLGSRALASDPSLRPVRGQVVVVANPGVQRTVLTDANLYAIAHPGEVVLGGTSDWDSLDTTPDPDVAVAIREAVARLDPRLGAATVSAHRVGLRPWRPEPRLEEDPRPPAGIGRLLHCYGHGGAGVTLSWGSAADVAALAGGPR